MPVSVSFDSAAFHTLLSNPSGEVTRTLYARGKHVETAAKRLCPVDHGRLRASITTQVVSRNGVNVIRVGTDVAYARMVHEGTGIYGPTGHRIFPVTATMLSWQKGGTRMYAKSVAGMKGTPYLTGALPAVLTA